jgi:O-acetyl-ADP-ribose deacetylase (regulator of RNase III)
LAHEKHLKTIAFPFVGTGFVICPIEETSKIALSVSVEHLKRFPDIEKVFLFYFQTRTWISIGRILRPLNS